jgi:glycyl-tRNA synthetase
LGVTVDYETLSGGTVTVRDRESWQQVRAPVDDLAELVQQFFVGRLAFGDLGFPVQEGK